MSGREGKDCLQHTESANHCINLPEKSSSFGVFLAEWSESQVQDEAVADLAAVEEGVGVEAVEAEITNPVTKFASNGKNMERAGSEAVANTSMLVQDKEEEEV